MCGITLVIDGLFTAYIRTLASSLLGVDQAVNVDAAKVDNDLIQKCLEASDRRGPSLQGCPVVVNTAENVKVTLKGSVLHLRGKTVASQPFLPTRHRYGQVMLLWNGEAFGGNLYERVEQSDGLSDTEVVANALQEVFDSFCDKEATDGAVDAFRQSVVETVFEKIEGPYSCVIYFPWPLNEVWFGKDKLGRRSLCWALDSGESGRDLSCNGEKPTESKKGTRIIVSSSIPDVTTNVYPVPVEGLFFVSLSEGRSIVEAAGGAAKSGCQRWRVPLPFRLESFLSSLSPPCWEDAINEVEAVLIRSVKKRMLIPLDSDSQGHVALMFSGGLDSGILAALMLKTLPPGCTLDLINVACGPPLLAPDRLTALVTYGVGTLSWVKRSQRHLWVGRGRCCRYKELLELFPCLPFRLICVDSNIDEVSQYEASVLAQVHPKVSHMDLNIGIPLFFASRGIGFVLSPAFASDANAKWWKQLVVDFEKDICVRPKPPRNASVGRLEPCPTGVAKDDGRATTIPARCRCCGFRVAKTQCTHCACRSCCRRLCEERTLKGELACGTECQAHRVRLPADVENEEELVTRKLSATRPPRCLYTIATEQQSESPWSRAEGCLGCERGIHPEPMRVTSLAPIIFTGHGADELFGGYGRHATAARHGGTAGLRSEMLKDLNRLWDRNLGRDDRCISYWGREARHPFLDEEVLRFVGTLSMAYVMMDSTGEDKKLLRLLARKLGLRRCATFKKRAIQFGTRSARQTNLKHFSSNRKAKGSARYCVPV